MIYTYVAFGGQSERVIDQYDEVDIEDPVTGIISVINWITTGYADGDLLDGKGNTLRSFLASGINQATGEPVTISQLGQDVAFLNIPLLCTAAKPNQALLVYNVPKMSGIVYDVTVVSTTPTGQDTAIDGWTVRITGKK